MSQSADGGGASSKASRSLAYVVLKTLLLAALVGGALVVSVVMSVVGLTIVLVVAAVGALLALNFRHHTVRAPAPVRPRTVMLITGLVIVGFFVALSIVGAVWPR